ncbi:MamI family restriction endonuclease [Xanthomonas phaseoli]|uniref:MamI family restriction endonuclease n=1 Tax=Xanthomonas phaseoli TaxID=1985254 RepID=UPI001EE63DA8|nr:MamI family restriction endonuclease [Xanthomonas phaseoli]
MFFGKALLHVQSPSVRELDSKLRCYSKSGGRRPGHQPAEHYPLSPLTTFSRSQNLTAGKVREFAARLEVELPINASKAVLLKTAQDAITARKLDSDVVVDALARTLYATEIAPHLAGLPASMRQQMAGANLL